MKLDVLVACYNEGIREFASQIPKAQESVAYKIVHQQNQVLNTLDKNAIDLLSSRQDVELVQVNEKGLSKSRNRALEMSKGDLALVCDEDVQFLPDFYSTICEGFKEHSKSANLAAITFMYLRNGQPAKKYRPKTFRHHRFTLGSVSSIEVVLNMNWLRKKNLRFDERFGLGAHYGSGEEYIFLQDINLNKGRLFFYPKAIVAHEEETTGAQWTDELIKAKGAVFKRVFGGLTWLVLRKFSNRKYREAGMSKAKMRSLLKEGAKAFASNG